MAVYLLVAAISLGIAITLWLLWRRWVWDNIFGVCMVSSLGLSVGPVRLRVGEFLELSVGDSPHWMVVICLAILHFLALNKQRLLDGDPRKDSGSGELFEGLDALADEPREAWRPREGADIEGVYAPVRETETCPVEPSPDSTERNQGVTYCTESHIEFVRAPLLALRGYALWR